MILDLVAQSVIRASLLLYESILCQVPCPGKKTHSVLFTLFICFTVSLFRSLNKALNKVCQLMSSAAHCPALTPTPAAVTGLHRAELQLRLNRKLLQFHFISGVNLILSSVIFPKWRWQFLHGNLETKAVSSVLLVDAGPRGERRAIQLSLRPRCQQ